ncbi:hypothetical protein CMN23_03695 [Candidatus Saccharibacteria bacterium]|nr:hypothetical protein [Candidatus Saccharibacteria bacterium]
MVTFLIILTLLLTICLIIVAGVRIEPHIISRFELGRRATGRDSAAKRILEREERLSELVTLLRVKQSLLLVLVVFCAIGAFGWLWGALYALLVSLTFGAVARTSLAQKLSSALWERSEPHVLRWLDRLRPVSRTLRVDAVIDAEMYRRFDSREELGKLIQQSKDILSANDRLLLSHGLQFAQKHVDEVMTPRAAIDSIKKGEFLGPLTLSELHDLGHSRLPVTDGDLDHIVGILHLRDLLSLDNKKSATAEKVMEQRVFYIHQEDTLEHALAAFIRTRRHLFVVINGNRETVGLLSLEDVVEALLGRKIMDEDDVHEDLHAVARQRGQHNNRPDEHIDL